MIISITQLISKLNKQLLIKMKVIRDVNVKNGLRKIIIKN